MNTYIKIFIFAGALIISVPNSIHANSHEQLQQLIQDVVAYSQGNGLRIANIEQLKTDFTKFKSLIAEYKDSLQLPASLFEMAQTTILLIDTFEAWNRIWKNNPQRTELGRKIVELSETIQMQYNKLHSDHKHMHTLAHDFSNLMLAISKKLTREYLFE